jgi:hypothetical protein
VKGLHYVAIDPKIASDPKVAAMAKRLHKDRHWVAGHFPAFFGEVAAHAPDGNLSGIPDDLLDQWAGGVKGWGKMVRDLLCTDGTLNAWMRYNGRAIGKAEADRARKREFRHGNSADIPRKFRGHSADIPTTIPEPEPEPEQEGKTLRVFPSLEGKISPNGRAA